MSSEHGRFLFPIFWLVFIRGLLLIKDDLFSSKYRTYNMCQKIQIFSERSTCELGFCTEQTRRLTVTKLFRNSNVSNLNMSRAIQMCHVQFKCVILHYTKSLI